MNKRETAHMITFIDVYVRIVHYFLKICILNLFHKLEGGRKFHHCKGLKRYFWRKCFFPSWNTVMYMLVQTAWLHISCVSIFSSSAYGVMLCFSCAAQYRSRGDFLICGGVLCRFPIQSQLAYSGSKVQLNSVKLTDFIRKYTALTSANTAYPDFSTCRSQSSCLL